MAPPWLSRLFMVTMMKVGVRAARRFADEAQHATKVSEELLQALLWQNRDTQFGRRHGFASLRSAEDFRRALPLATFEDFRADVERIARGEQNVLTADKVLGLHISSGTTGRPKLVPVTRASQERMSHYMAKVGRGFLADLVPGSRRGEPGLVVMSAALSSHSEAGLPIGSASALAIRGVLRLAPLMWVSPVEVYEIRSLATALYLHLLFGLPRQDLAYLSAPFASAVLDLLRTLEQRGPELVEDLGRGTLSASLELEPAVRRSLQAQLRPQPEVARRLERELGRGSEGLATRLWPKLSYVVTISGGSFAAYVPLARHYVGSLPFYSAFYASSEGMLGVGTSVEHAHYVIPPAAAFFEFIPADAADQPQPQTRLMGELEVGGRYELVVTPPCGLYRYRMGDVVEVVGWHQRAPVVEFLYRRGTLLDLASEKTSEDEAQVALMGALARAGVRLVDYTIMPDLSVSPVRYVYLLELEPGHGLREPEAWLGQQVEAELCKAAPHYADMREGGRLGALAVRLVEPGAFRALRERLIERGASPTQVKVPRVLRDEELLRVLLGARADPAPRRAAQA